MRFADYMEKNCFFWINTLLFVNCISAFYDGVVNYNVEDRQMAFAILTFFTLMVILGIIIFFNEYFNSLGEIIRLSKDNWMFLLNCFSIYVFLGTLLILLNWKVYDDFEIKYSLYVVCVYCATYMFLVYKNFALFCKDFKKNVVRYIDRSAIVILQILFLSYLLVTYLFLNHFDYMGRENWFEKYIQVVNSLSIAYFFLYFAYLYIRTLFKKMKIFFLEVVIN